MKHHSGDLGPGVKKCVSQCAAEGIEAKGSLPSQGSWEIFALHCPGFRILENLVHFPEWEEPFLLPFYLNVIVSLGF